MKILGRICRHSRTLLILAATLALMACAGPTRIQEAGTTKTLLNQVHTLTGARIISRPMNVPIQSNQKSVLEYLPFLSPTEVSGYSNYLYILDSGRRQIFQFDQAQQGMFLFADLPVSMVSSITVSPDLSLYATDIASHAVLHFSSDGKLLQTFSNRRELSRPIAVLADYATGQVIVADSLYNQIVVFNSLGRLQSIIRPPEARSIEAMARGPDGLYLVDRLSRRIVVIGNDGEERYIFGSDTLKDPVAIAVDRYNRVFIGDNFDNTIKIYERGRWLETFGGTGATPGLFNHGNSLWLEQDTLYVADSLNARIQVFRIASK